MKRLFIAADLDNTARQQLTEFMRTVAHCGGKINFTAPENLHITLAFLGDTQDREIPKIIQAAADAVHGVKALTFCVQGAKLIGPEESPKMIWANVTEGHDSLAALADNISAAIAPLGFKPETRPFNAHVTLARIKYAKDPHELENRISPAAEKFFGKIHLQAVTIYESILKPTGPIYLPLHSCKLG